MGIAQLSKLIRENTKRAYRERPLAYYANKKVVIDAPMAIYQFLIAIRSDDGVLGIGEKTTSHLVGTFYRTISMVEAGLQPVFVFDGVAPELKLGELLKRRGRRETALEKYEEAREIGDIEKMAMYEKRQAKVCAEHIEDCKALLELMGIPTIVAPSEAEAYCALLVKKKLADAVATEDMDALAFGAPVLLRNVTASKSKKLPVREYNLAYVLEDLGLTQNEFIDLCILLGCDFCEGIRGVGPKTALALVKEFRSIDAIIEHKKNLSVPDNWNYEKARLIFQNLANDETTSIDGIRWDSVCPAAIKSFLVDEHGFSEDRVEKGLERFFASRKRGTQRTLDSFFGSKK